MKKTRLITFSIFVAITITLAAYSIETKTKTEGNQKEIKSETTVDWEVRDEYVKDGEILLRVAPDPTLVAGKQLNICFIFAGPFETFEGRDLAIYAFHKETEKKLTIVAPKTITEPSSGYSSLQRYTATFEVPFGGL
jgi:hypothetical protein